MNAGQMLAQVRVKKPLIHHITNAVTVSECANITLHAGGLPVMANAREEVAEMVAQAGALVLNIGTLTREQVEAMMLAGKKANELGIPVVLDPVGTGATRMRTESALKLLEAVKVAVIKGNAAEIAVLAGGEGKIRGVESVGVAGEVENLAVKLAQQSGSVVAVTGPADFVTDGKKTMKVFNGHPLMGKVVGTGCMSASVVGCFVAVFPTEPLKATAAALAAFGVAGERAAGIAATPAAFKTAFLDSLYLLDEKTLAAEAAIKEGEV